MSMMTSHETMERFEHGLKKAASLCRQIAKARRSKAWLLLAAELDRMRDNGERLYNSRPLSRGDALGFVNKIMDKERTRQELEKVTETKH